MILVVGGGAFMNEMSKRGFNIKGLEYSQDPIKLAKQLYPNLHIFQGDMTKFCEPNQYDLIFSREVYVVTRVNAFSDQYNMICNIIKSLKSGGIFILIGSDVSYPHCMDYDLMIQTIKKEPYIDQVYGKVYEKIFTHFNQFFFTWWQYKVIKFFLTPYIMYRKKKENWATQYIIGFRKK